MRKGRIVGRKQLEKKVVLGMMVTLLFVSMLTLTLNIQQVKAESKTILTIAVPSPPQGTECTLEATLLDENDNPLQNTDIGFYICGTEKIGTAKTDSNGVASLKYTLPQTTGTYKFNAVFSGTTNYAQSSSEDVYIPLIVIDYTPYLVGGGIIAVAIIGVVGYIVFRGRKTTITMPKMAKEAYRSHKLASR